MRKKLIIFKSIFAQDLHIYYYREHHCILVVDPLFEDCMFIIIAFKKNKVKKLQLYFISRCYTKMFLKSAIVLYQVYAKIHTNNKKSHNNDNKILYFYYFFTLYLVYIFELLYATQKMLN